MNNASRDSNLVVTEVHKPLFSTDSKQLWEHRVLQRTSFVCQRSISLNQRQNIVQRRNKTYLYYVLCFSGYEDFIQFNAEVKIICKPYGPISWSIMMWFYMKQCCRRIYIKIPISKYRKNINTSAIVLEYTVCGPYKRRSHSTLV